MTASTQTVSSVQPHNSNQAVSAERQQSLGASLPQGWIVEWSGQKGRKILHAAVLANTSLTNDPVGLIVQYLRKNDIFGLQDLKKAAGGEDELAKLIGEYNPEQPLPHDIDDEMQAPLSQYFNAETLRAFHDYRTSQGMPRVSKMTELYSLYWGPASMTPNIAEKLAMKHGTQFHQYSWKPALQEHGNRSIGIDCWIAFPNDVFGRSKPFQEQAALIPPGFELSHFPEAVFCPLVRFACTRERIVPENPLTCIRCPEETQGYKVAVGGFGAGGLDVNLSYYDRVNDGVAFVRKFCFGH